MARLIGSISEFFSALTFIEGVLLILLLLGGFWIYKSHQRQLDDRQREIDRLAADNREYRDRFERIMNQKLGPLSDNSNK